MRGNAIELKEEAQQTGSAAPVSLLLRFLYSMQPGLSATSSGSSPGKGDRHLLVNLLDNAYTLCTEFSNDKEYRYEKEIERA